MTDNYRRYSESLVQKALDGIGKGDPRAVGFLADIYDYLHPQSRRAVFKAIRQRFELTRDEELAERVHAGGIAGLAIVHPQLARAIRDRTDRTLEVVVHDLRRPKWGDINATTSQAHFLRTLFAGLPLHAILGAWLRVRTAKVMVASKRSGQSYWRRSGGRGRERAEPTKGMNR